MDEARPAPAPRLPKMAELVADRIRGQIVRGELRDGDHLPAEARLVTGLGVSRATVREALRILESEGLLSVRRGARGGPRVNLPAPDVMARHAGLILQHQQATYDELAEARALVEPYAVEVLARRGRAADVRALRTALAEFDPDRPERTATAQPAFHIGLVELAGNRVLGLMTRVIERVTEASLLHDYMPRNPVEGRAGLLTSHRMHVKVVDRIETGDVAGAVRVWRGHVREGTDLLRGSGRSTETIQPVQPIAP